MINIIEMKPMVTDFNFDSIKVLFPGMNCCTKVVPFIHFVDNIHVDI